MSDITPKRTTTEAAREARRKWYAKNAAAESAKAVIRNRGYKQRNEQFVTEVKSQTPCADCGVQYPSYVMQFDHTGNDKENHVSRMVWQAVTLERIKAEIAKCEIVCANCHMIRTHSRRVKAI